MSVETGSEARLGAWQTPIRVLAGGDAQGRRATDKPRAEPLSRVGMRFAAPSGPPIWQGCATLNH
jgi:hypothetical protein